MRILGIDIGSKRIGVALSDELGIIAQGLPTLERTKDEDIVESLKDIVKTKDVKEVVVGLPINMNGSYGPQAKGAIAFTELLKEKLKIPIKLWDERMTTLEVEKVMIDGGVSRQKRKTKIDKLAAQVILQSYLNSTKHV